MGSDLSYISALSINSKLEGQEISKTAISKARIDRYGRKLLADMKKYNQGLYTELLFSGGLEDWLMALSERCKVQIWDYV